MPRVHPTAYIDDSAQVIGEVEIDEESSVWMAVPPRSLVMGRPAKVRRSLTDAEVATIQMYADRYVQYRLDYMGG